FSAVEQELARESGDEVEFRIITEGTRLPLHPLVRDEVFRIGQEALRNAFRHAKAARIEMLLTYTPNLLKLGIRDDGCGIDPKTLTTGRDGHFGLSGMRERAERIGAHLRLLSYPGAGTEIDLQVPGQVAYQTKETAK